MRYLMILFLLATRAFAGGTNDWCEWLPGADAPTFGPVKERPDGRGGWIYPRPHYKGTFGYTPDNPSPVWYRVQYDADTVPEGWEAVQTAWVQSNGLAVQAVTVMTNLAIKAEQEAIAASNALVAAEAAHQAWCADMATNAPPVGTMVKLLRGYLVDLGFEPPFSVNNVTATMLGEMATGTLTEERRINMQQALNLYKMLGEMALEEEQIRDIRVWMEENGLITD